MKTSTFTWRKIKTDAKMKFYTGTNALVPFNKIFRLIQPCLSDVIYLTGPKHAKNFSKIRHQRCNITKKLSQRDEFLLTSMYLRLELLNEVLAERFGVSPTLCSYIFTTWIKLLSKILGKALVVWPPKESIWEHLPETFLKSSYGECRVIKIVQRCLLKDQNHYLLRLLHGQTTSTITHLNFWLELHPLGLFRSSLLVMGVEQVTNLSPEIVDFIIY